MLLIVSCGSEIKENPTNCAVKEVSEGVEFSCVDKEGKQTSGVVKHGEAGAKGEKGDKGDKGESLFVKSVHKCSGEIESSSGMGKYSLRVDVTAFENGHAFIASQNLLIREGEVINKKFAAAYYLTSIDLVVEDGIFSMIYHGDKLSALSRSGMAASLPCVEVKQ